jgi:hypothetical protein
MSGWLGWFRPSTRFLCIRYYLEEIKSRIPEVTHSSIWFQLCDLFALVMNCE